MPGKAYTMKEMKQIVDYLAENKLYSETKGRKMWVDMEKSRVLNRTWQSMKETFIKRIFHELHNPYYRLSVEQISSFRQGFDVTSRNKNKLEIHTFSDDDSNSADKQKSIETPSNGNENEDKKTGEDISSKIQTRSRSSTETLVLDNCYETAEDVLRELESPIPEDEAPKTLRDLITYSEPLTPMLQDVIDDFSTDDDEPRMQIVEDVEIVPDKEETTSKPESPETVRESKSINNVTENSKEKEEQPSKIKSLKLKKSRKGTWENKEGQGKADIGNAQEIVANHNESHNVFTCENDPSKSNSTNIAENTGVAENDTMLTNDTPLPNNQEGLAEKPTDNRTSTESASDLLEPRKKKESKSRKRSRSQDSTDRKSKKNEKRSKTPDVQEQNKDTQTFDSHPHAAMAVDEKTSDANKSDVTHNNSAQSNKAANSDNDQNTSVNKTSNEGTSQEAGPSHVNDIAIDQTDINPCLKSVNLFAEQYSLVEYISSENEENSKESLKIIEEPKREDTMSPQIESEIKKSESQSANQKVDNSNETKNSSDSDVDKIILLKSHSESEGENAGTKKINSNPFVNKSRNKAIAHIFGFPSGSHRKINQKSKHASQRYRRCSRLMTNHMESGSSDEYTTESDSEAVHPRRRRCEGKYVKPPSYDILEHPSGGVFVVGRKKVYPLLIKENGALNYTLAGENSDAGPNDSYWKKKYLEQKDKCVVEKLRAYELSRKLQKSKESKESATPQSPILQPKQSLSTTNNENEVNQPKPKETAQEKEEPKGKETVKIHFTVNNLGMEVEGQWPHINPVLERMVDILKSNEAVDKPKGETNNQESSTEAPKGSKKEPKQSLPKESGKRKEKVVESKLKKSEEPVEISSGVSTPVVNGLVDPETHERVNKLENEIFKTIEEIDKSDQNVSDVASDVHVTKRKRGRPRKVPSLSTGVSSVESEQKKETKKASTAKANKRNLTPQSESSITSPKRTNRAPRRYESDSGIVVNTKIKRSVSKLSLQNESRVEAIIPDNDPSVRYMLPPLKTGRLQNNATTNKSSNSYSDHETRLLSPDSSSRHSESTQGYQDSDISPPSALVKKKRRMSAATLFRKSKRKTSPYLADDDSCESIAHQKLPPVTNLSLSSEAYISESYQLLMPKQKNFTQLDKIDEISDGFSPIDVAAMIPLTMDVNYNIASHEHRGQMSSEGNSSNFSLPLSPELSVVESLSVSRELIGSIPENHPTLNESQGNAVVATEGVNKFLMSEVDVSAPLMDQDCEFRNKQKKNIGARGRRISIAEFVQTDKYNSKKKKDKDKYKDTANAAEQSTSDSLDQRLRDMILESAKKMTQTQTVLPEFTINMEIDATESAVKKAKAKKRCSTPRKRKTVQKSTTPIKDPIIEEHTETCSYSGRRSCPPVINILPCEKTVLANTGADKEAEPVKSRKKKDVIKVKILRPKPRLNRTQSASRLSVFTDSGINDTGSVSDTECKCCASTELIHNHSDTCLNMDECVGDSIELIENTQSIISVNSNSLTMGLNHIVTAAQGSNDERVTPELFCSNAQDATCLENETIPPLHENDVDTATVYHTPKSDGSYASLMTEDLSDDAPLPLMPSWYLLSEEDTNYADASSQNPNSRVFGSNLQKIFPVTYAVPDLSTITETSKGNESSKASLNTEAEMAIPSQSVFDL